MAIETLGRQPFVPVPLAQPRPGFGETFGAAFRQGNDIANIMELSERPVFELDPNFNSIDFGKGRELYDRYGEELAVAQSEEEFLDIERRLRQREEDLSMLSARGWQGFAMMMTAGLLSPTTLIPFTGELRGAKGIVQAFALAGVASAAQELPIAMNQVGDTTSEMVINIGAGTVLGGLLGSAAVMLSPAARMRIADDLPAERLPIGKAQIDRAENGRVSVEGEMPPLRTPADLGHGPGRVGVAGADYTPSIPPVAGATRRTEGNVTTIRAEPDDPNMATITTWNRRQYQTQAEANPIPVRMPEVPTGYIRFFHGTPPKGNDPSSGGGRWVAPAADYAYNYRNVDGEADLYFIDLPVGHPLEVAARSFTDEDITQGLNNIGLYKNFEVPEEFTRHFRKAEDSRIDVTPTGQARAVGAASTSEPFVPEAISRYDNPNFPRGAGDIVGASSRLNPVTYVAKTSPITRLIQQSGFRGYVSEVLRSTAQALDDTGLVMRNNRLGVATTEGGSVTARKHFYYALLADALRTQHEAYFKYITDGKLTYNKARMANAYRRATFRKWPGKMSYAQFKEAVVDARNVPGTPANKYVAEVAARWQTDFYDKINTSMLDATDAKGVKALYKILDQSPDKGYFTHVFSTENIAADPEGFIKMVADHYENNAANYYRKRLLAIQKYIDETTSAERVLNLERDVAVSEMERLTTALKMIRHPDQMEARWDEADALRDEARMLEDAASDKEIYDEDFAEWYAETYGDDTEGKLNALDQAKELRRRADEIEAEIPEEANVKSLDEVRQLELQLRLLRKSFGGVEAKAQKLEEQIARNEEMSLKTLNRIVRATRTLIRGMDKLDDKKLDAAIDKLVAQVDRQEALLYKGRERLERMAPGDVEKFSLESGRQLTRQLKDLRLRRNLDDAKSLDRVRAREMLDAKLEDTMRTVNRLNEMRGRRNQKLIAQKERYTPDAVLRTIGDRRAEELRRIADFEESVRKGGGDSAYMISRGTDFEFRESAEAIAKDLMDKILGNYTRLGQLESLPGLQGPMKHRVLNIPYAQKKKYLEMDSEKVIARYAETIGSDIEMFRAFGDVSGKKALDAVRDDFHRIQERIAASISDPEKRARALQKFDQQAKKYTDTLGALLLRARGMWGLQSSKGSIGVRAGRMMLNWNVASMMGTVTISSVSDVHRAITAYGLIHTFRSSWVPLLKAFVGNRTAIRDIEKQFRMLKTWGIGIDTWTQARARGTFDLLPPDPYMTRGERIMEGMAASMPIVAGFGYWTDAMKLMTGMATLARFTDVIERAVEGAATADEITWMASMGINELYARRIWASMNDEGGADRISSGALIPNTGRWDDREAARALEAAMARESDRLIISPGLEKPLWTDASMPGRMISQFRGFMFSSNIKATVGLAQTQSMREGVNHLTGFLSSMALGAASYYLWALTSGKDAREEMENASWGVWIDQALMRGGYLGVLGEVQNVGLAIPATSGIVSAQGLLGDEAQQLAGRRADNLWGAVAGPTYGTIEDIFNVLQGIDEPTQGTVNTARKLLPYQNVFYLKGLFEQVEQGVNGMFNLPKRRGQ